MLVIIIGRALQFALALLMMKAATTLLSPEEMGEVSLVLTSIAFFAMLLINPVGMFINRRLHGWEDRGATLLYLSWYTGYLGLISVLAGGVMYGITSAELFELSMPTSWLIALISATLFFNTINQTAIPCINLLGDSRRFVILTVATILLSLLSALLIAYQFAVAPHYWLLGILIGQAVVGFIGVGYLIKRIAKSQHQAGAVITKDKCSILLSFAWPVAIAAGFGWLQSQGYRYFFEEYLSLAQLGLFVAGYAVSAGIIAAYESVFTTYFQPQLYKKINSPDDNEKKNAWQQYASVIIPSLLITVVVISVSAPELTRLLLGENFQESAQFLVWGAIAEAGRVLIGVYSLVAHIYMKTKWLIIPTILGAFLSIGLCIVAMKYWGVEGVGLALSVAGALVVIVMHFMYAARIRANIFSTKLKESIVYSLVIFVVAVLFKGFYLESSWFVVLSYLGVIGMAFLFFQYILLKESLKRVVDL